MLPIDIDTKQAAVNSARLASLNHHDQKQALLDGYRLGGSTLAEALSKYDAEQKQLQSKEARLQTELDQMIEDAKK